MSLITRRGARNLVTVYPGIETTDIDGGTIWTYSTEGIQVRCNVHSMSSDNLNRSSTTMTEYHGNNPNDTYIITAPPGTWPKGAESVSKILWHINDPTGGVTEKWLYQNTRIGYQRVGRATRHDKIVVKIGNEIEA